MAKAAKKTAAKTAKKSTAKKPVEKLGDPAKTVELFDIEGNDLLKEMADFNANKKKAAGRRARKHSQTIIKLLRTLRKEIQGKINAM